MCLKRIFGVGFGWCFRYDVDIITIASRLGDLKNGIVSTNECLIELNCFKIYAL